MKVLIACEESQAVCTEFRKRGHEAYSCDIQECSGGHPEWHIQDDVLKHLDENWDLIIAHPPCTYLTVTGNRWFSVEKYGLKALEREQLRHEAYLFFMKFVYANAPRIAIENPIGRMSTFYRKPDQIIQPYMFGDRSRKATCLWLKGLPKLVSTDIVEPEIVSYMIKNGKKAGKIMTQSADYGVGYNTPHGTRRSKTYPGIARAMAEQWG